jgi:hypothetical protein
MTKEKMRPTKALFSAGQVVMTQGVRDLCRQDPRFAEFVSQSLQRHVGGDWGALEAKDRWANDLALIKHERLLSAYNDARFPQHGVATLWVITEADRSATTILFPDEY